MSDRRVDYDRIAPAYDERFQASQLDPVGAAMAELARQIEAGQVLEVGCGTGRWLDELGAESRHLIGLDLSSGMLAEARRRCSDLCLVQGRGGRLPFRSQTFDLATCVNALHHFGDPRAFVREARRVLKPSGVLVVVGSNPHDQQGAWYVYDFFHGTLEVDLERFPSWGTTLDWMVGEGFERVEWRLVQRVVDHKIGREVLDDHFLGKNACSQLALLNDQAYEAGLRRIESAVEEAEALDQTVVFRVDIRIGALIGRSSG